MGRVWVVEDVLSARWTSVPPMRAAAGALIAGGLLVAACSGDGDAGGLTTVPGTVVTSVDSTGPPTTDPPPTTTDPPAPTTTEDPTATLIAQIEADLNEGEQVFLAGAQDPANPESRAALERHFTDDALAQLTEFYDALVADGLIARPNADVPSTIRVLELVGRESSDAAEIVYCRIDAGVVVDPMPDGREAIVNDAVTRYDTRTQVFRIEGVWTIPGTGELIGKWPAATSCD